ncbi:hypothetical protein NAT65_01525 [Achromobacter xylosoxidans]|nr:hypothetical protein [Achromobacter xylosoxidans]MCM2569751.1 hypothetical protein [Achromobacter xylosoxidans]
MTALYLLALPLAIIIGAVTGLVLSPHRQQRRRGTAAPYGASRPTYR